MRDRARRARNAEIQGSSSDAGDTLIEVLLALIVVGLTVVAILGAFATTIFATAEHRTLASNDTVLRTFSEYVNYELRLASPPQFIPCAMQNQYQTPIANTWQSTYAPSGYTVSLVVNGYNGPGCQAFSTQNPPNPLPPNPPAEMLTATVTSSGGSDQLQLVVMSPDSTGSGSGTYSISPTSGPAADPPAITISAGSGLSFNGATSVNFLPIGGGAPTQVTVFTVTNAGEKINIDAAHSPPETNNNYQVYLTVTLQSGATTIPGAADLFSYGPTISSIDPPADGPVAGGTQITINGNGFDATSTVEFGSTPAVSVTYTGSSTQLQALSPPGAGVVDVQVTTENGASPLNPPADEFTYTLAVTSVTPPGGPAAGGNGGVTIQGSGFVNVTAVDFGGNPVASGQYTVNPNQTSIVVNSVPAGSATVDVTVTVSTGAGSQTSLINRPGDQYTYSTDEPAGIAVEKSGSAGTVTCGAGSGNGTCSIPTAGTCAIVGASTTPTNPMCRITGLGNNGSVTLFVELVDTNGQPVPFSPGAISTISLSNACATNSPRNNCVTSMSIGSGADSTTPNTLTASYNGNQGVTASITLTSGTTTFTLTLRATS
jgi:hypothetical protein